MVKKRENVWFVMGGIIALLIISIIIIQVQNKERENELEKELQTTQEEKVFCDNLEISIEKSGSPYGISVGVNYAFCSNQDISAKSIITMADGRKIEERERLENGACLAQQIIYIAGYSGKISCDDIESIELVSDRCSQVKDLVNMDEVTCGI